MFKYFDGKKAIELINRELNTINGMQLIEVEMGMLEDWGNVSAPIWTKESGFLIDLNKHITVSGIDGSHWATPIIVFNFPEGIYRKEACWKYPDWNEVVV